MKKSIGFNVNSPFGFGSSSFGRFLGLLGLLILFSVSDASYIGDSGSRIHEETACDGYEMTLKCPGTGLINVQLATYGRLDDRTCITNSEAMSNTHCSLESAQDIISSKCNGKGTCSFTVNRGSFRDPCPGTSKYLNTIWRCLPSVATCPGNLHSVTHERTYRTSKATNGAWLRDPFQHTQKIYYMGWSKYDSSQLNEYVSAQALVDNQQKTFYHLPDRVDGTGFVVYDGSVYYNKERSRTIVKYDLGKGVVSARKDLPNANYHETSAYAIGLATDIDLAVDESGLWVIYATEANEGNIVISRLQPQSLAVLNTWFTSYEKLSALNAFIACGVLYVVDYDSLRIDYMFNTTSNTEKQIHVAIPGLSDTTSAIEYNPKDQTLYMWDSSVASTYKIKFEPFKPPTTTTTTTRPTTSTTTTTPRPTLAATVNVPKTAANPPASPITVSPSTNLPRPAGFCQGKEASGLEWPKTPFSETAFLDCPGNAPGQAMWICGGNASRPQWTTQLPDLSQCFSQWLKDLEQEIDVGRTSVSELSQKLAKTLHEKSTRLTSWDIVMVVKLLRRFLHEPGGDTTGASDLADAVLKCSSELLHPAMSPLWKGLGNNMQTETAVSLGDVLEEAAFFLAKDMINNDAINPALGSSTEDDKVTLSESYVTLAIRIEPVMTSSSSRKTPPTPSTSSRVALSSGHGDVVTVDDRAIKDALHSQPGDKLAVVHLSFKNLGGYLVDSNGFGSTNYPVNSQVLALSVKAMRQNGVWSEEAGSLQLKRPVTLQLQHIDHHLKNHVCAFWSIKSRPEVMEGSWSRSGCKLVEGNSSHSTCQCDHLTNFVILSSDHDFPLMGADAEELVTHDVASDFLRYINVVRGGMTISVISLVVVAIALIRHSRRLDLNTIHKNLVFSLLVSELIFLIGIDLVKPFELCTAIAVILHYGVLCTFTWAALEAFHHLATLRDIQERNNRWRYYYGVAYGLPAVVVICSVTGNLSGYTNQNVCWMKANSDLIWAFIVPCCTAICSCVFLVALLLYKMSKDQTTFTEVTKNIRVDAARTCTLMFLLCAMWSCGFLWLSGFQSILTAWLFAFFSAAHGLASLLLYCIFRPEISLSGVFWCWKKSESRLPRRVSTSAARLVPRMTLRENSRPDHTTTTVCSDYLYSAARCGTTTTLIPATGNCRITLAKAASAMEGGERATLMEQRASATLSHDLVAHETVRSSPFNAVDDNDPKLPTPRITPQCGTASWNDYAPTGSRSCLESSCSRNDRVYPLATAPTCNCAHCLHQYERPSNASFCATSSTAYSCCYDHLHDDQLLRNGLVCTRKSCNNCKQQMQIQQTASQRGQPNPHLYETLGPFSDEDGSTSAGGSLPFNSCPSDRHCYEDVSSSQTQVRDNHVMCNHRHPLDSMDVRQDRTVCGHGSSTMCRKDTYGLCACARPGMSKTSPGFVAASDGDSPYYRSHNGRSSDPLSTDQGYDTDSQQLSHLVCRNSHSDVESGHLFPPGAKLQTAVADDLRIRNMPLNCHKPAKERPVNAQTSNVCRRRNSLSVGSDCGSENDREVEFINSGSSVSRDFVDSNCEETGLLSQPPVACGSENDTLTAIETCEGGLISPTDTVTSWAALAGTKARAAYPAPVHKTDKKTTVDPKLILAQARQRRDVRNSVDSLGSSCIEDRTNFNGYTLPGTAEAGTKARIDLRTGGISMITNL